MSKEDKEQLIPLQFDDYDYVLAFKLTKPIPLEVGRVSALQHNGSDFTRMDLANCTDVLSESTIEASSQGDSKFGYDDVTFCLKPEQVATS